MDIHIVSGFESSTEDSLALDELRDMLASELDREVKAERSTPPSGSKDGGLTIALAIGNLTVGLIKVCLDLVKMWRESQTRYKLKVRVGDIEVSLDNLTASELDKQLAALSPQDQILTIEITK